MLWVIAASVAGGIVIGWQFPQPEWTKQAWVNFKEKWLK